MTIQHLAPSAADLANPAPQVFTIDQLAISPLNVRFNEVAIEKVDALRAQIVAEGLLQPLVIHPVPKRAKWAGKAGYGVFAGGRRCRAIRAATLWTDAIALLAAHPAFAAETDPPEALRAFLEEKPGFKRLAEAVLAGLALVRSANTPGWRVPAHDAIAKALGGSSEHVRRFWQPTAAFTGLFSKLARQEMVAPFVDEAERRALARAKDRDLSVRTAEILAKQDSWLHPLLAFAAPPVEDAEYQGFLEEDMTQDESPAEPEPVE